MRYAGYGLVLLALGCFFLAGCGEEKAGPVSTSDEVLVAYVDDPGWIAEHFEEREGDDLVLYDVTVPVDGMLSLSLIDRANRLFTPAGFVRAGTTRVAFQYWTLTGKDILEDDVKNMMKQDEVDLFKRTFPDFEDRCLLMMNSVRQNFTGRINTEAGENKLRGTTSSVSNSIPYPQHIDVGGHVSFGATMVDGFFRAKIGEPAIVYTWAWGASITTRFEKLILDENNHLSGMDMEGKPVSGDEFESPLWVLVLKFEPEEIGGRK